jgi:hypothetical protein
VASNVPIMLDYYDNSDRSNKLIVTFDLCDFRVSLQGKNPQRQMAFAVLFRPE